jgi:hypothetical protein
MGIDPRLGSRLVSSNSKMPSHTPCDGPAPSNSASIHAIGTAITAAGISPGTGGKSKIFVSLDNNIESTVDGVVVPLAPTHT